MDSSRFDAAIRALGAGASRRGSVGLLAALAAAGAVRESDAKRRRRRCKPACSAQQACMDRQCTCPGGGTVCGPDCCLIGQECRDGQCVALPEPVTCIAYGEACKDVGKPCCESLVCGSGQGGQDDVACYVRKTGRCASTAECTFGTACVDGICVAPVCSVQLGDPCVEGDVCCRGACGPGLIADGRISYQPRCCVALGQSCAADRDCCVVTEFFGESARATVTMRCQDQICTSVVPPP